MASLPSDQDYVYSPSIVTHHNILSIAFETFVYGTTRVFLFPGRVPRGTYLTAFNRILTGLYAALFPASVWLLT